MNAIMDFINGNASGLLNTWLTMQLQTGLFVLIIFAIDMSLRNASPRFRYLLWSTALLKALLPPVVSLPGAAVGVLETVTLPVIDVSTMTAAASSGSLPAEAILTIAVMVIGLALAAVVVYRSIALHRSLTGAEPLSHSAWTEGPPVYVSSNIPSPVAVGVLRPRIYVTQDIADGGINILHAVLHHERAHIRRRDGLVVMLQSLVQIFYVLNPLIWLLNLRLFRYREQICDEEALLRTGTRPQDYGRLLVSYAEAQPSRIVQTGTCFFETRRGFVQRVSQLFHAREGRQMKRIHRIAIVVLLLVIVPLSWQCSEDTITFEETTYVTEERNYPDAAGENAAKTVMGDPIISKSEYVKEGKLKSMHGAEIVGGLAALSEKLVYPEHALKLGIQGTVFVKVRVIEDGPCESATLVRSSNSSLDIAALDAVKAVTYKAARRNGKILESELEIPIKFRLR